MCFGGPPAHIALLRKLCVEDRKWLDSREFEAALAACNLPPGPASTQLAIFCAWRVRGRTVGILDANRRRGALSCQYAELADAARTARRRSRAMKSPSRTLSPRTRR
jgi:hypothetical protein